MATIVHGVGMVRCDRCGAKLEPGRLHMCIPARRPGGWLAMAAVAAFLAFGVWAIWEARQEARADRTVERAR